MATGEITTSGTQTPGQLPNHKVKLKKSGQRACNEKNDKGKVVRTIYEYSLGAKFDRETVLAMAGPPAPPKED